MKTYYNVEIQMADNFTTSKELIDQIVESFGADKTAIDELEPYRAVLFFVSETTPTEVRKIAQAILCMHQDSIHYIDVVYRYEYEITPDRFVYWANGSMQEYTGHVVFEEDK